MTPLGVGFVLHPDATYLGLCRDIIEREAEFFEVAPETCWTADADGQVSATPWCDVFADMRRRSGRPFVGHGLALSPGTPSDPGEDERLTRWLHQIARDHERLDFRWYTEHLGWVSAEGQALRLPLPLPPTEEAARTVAGRLNRLRPIIPVVGFENQTSFFSFGDVRTEPPFWNRICAVGDCWLLLDLHNCYTQCLNHGVALDEYLAGLDLSRVLEIHLSGGSESEPGWLPSGRVFRMDSHDGPVPEPVWRAFAEVRPCCPNLRGVVVERLDGTIAPEEVPALRDEVRRARTIFWEA
jgi:uncharacterized protein (UPF0276 family)